MCGGCHTKNTTLGGIPAVSPASLVTPHTHASQALSTSLARRLPSVSQLWILGLPDGRDLPNYRLYLQGKVSTRGLLGVVAIHPYFQGNFCSLQEKVLETCVTK